MDRNSIFFNRQQSRLVDRLAIAAGTPGIDLMENAATGCAQWLIEHGAKNVFVFAGIGNNGGDGFAIARILRANNVNSKVMLCGDREKVTGDALTNLQRLEERHIDVYSWESDLELNQIVDPSFDWIVDALLGTGAAGDPRPPYDQVIQFINQADARVLAIDIPSGLDCDSGSPGNPTVTADLTCTFVTQKTGFQNEDAKAYIGEVRVIDIGVADDIVVQILAKQQR